MGSSAKVVSKLSEILAGVDRLHVLFATYRTIREIDPGITEPKPGLLIDVRSGIGEYSVVSGALLFGSIGLDDAETAGRLMVAGAQMMDEEGKAAQTVIDSDLTELRIQDGYQFLAVCYAGLTAFEQALRSATQMKSRVPGSKVILVTCDCDLSGKMAALQPNLTAGEIDLLVVTGNCGGEEVMRDILNMVVDFWPNDTAA